MTEAFSQKQFSGFSRLKLFWALSRTAHGLLDMCTPAFAALLWLGHFPPLTVIVLGAITTFAGYTAVYALNDIVDYRSDKEKAAAGEFTGSGSDLDGVVVRHPMAQNLLSFNEGLAWALGWSFVALVGAYLLNPICVLIFVGGCILEAIYCLLWRVSPYRTIVSGAVKTSGAIAAVFAVDPNPSASFLLILFLMFFCWEIGGQNVPNDWSDLEEDRRYKAQTIPVHFGPDRSIIIVLATLFLTLGLNFLVFFFTKTPFGISYPVVALIIGGYLLLTPAIQLHRIKESSVAMELFNKASYYPLALLCVVLAKLVF